METVKLERHGAVALVTLSRPERLNALSKPLLMRLDSVFIELAADVGTGAIVLTGEGRAFSAGADIKEQRGFSADEAAAHMRWGQAIFDRIEAVPKPTIAAINGVALGGGLELALACDLRLIATGARVGLPEITLGSFPGWGGTQRLPELIGVSRALQILFTGEPVSAAEALSLGLVNEVVDADGLRQRALALAQSMARHAPEALAELKSVVRIGRLQGRKAGMEAEARGVGCLWGSPAQQQAQQAFFARKAERRPTE